MLNIRTISKVVLVVLAGIITGIVVAFAATLLTTGEDTNQTVTELNCTDCNITDLNTTETNVTR